MKNLIFWFLIFMDFFSANAAEPTKVVEPVKEVVQPAQAREPAKAMKPEIEKKAQDQKKLPKKIKSKKKKAAHTHEKILKGNELTMAVADVQAKLKAIDSLKLKFVLTSFRKMRNISSEKFGQAKFKQPNYFLLEFEGAEAKTLIFDGNSFFEYYQNQNQAQKFSKLSAELKQLSQMIFRWDLLLENFNLSSGKFLASSEGQDKRLEISLEPRKSTDFEKIILAFNNTKDFLERVKMYAKNGNVTEYTFSTPLKEVLPISTFELSKTVKVTEGF